MRYAVAPPSVSYGDVLKRDFCLAPSKYAKIHLSPYQKATVENFGDIVTFSLARENVKPRKKYYYIEIGSVDVNTGRISYDEKPGFFVPKRPLQIKKDDILISKVRTNRKGIAFVNKDSDNLVCTSAFLVIRSVRPDITKEYLYSFLRHDIFVEQILSMQNRGSYPRLDKSTKDEVFVIVPKDHAVVEYVTLLTKALLRKEAEIQAKFERLNDLVESELVQNQKDKSFVYFPPTYSEVTLERRLDTGIFEEEYKRVLHTLKNYSNGFFCIPEETFKSGSTPRKRMIGRGSTNWVTPSIISDFGYFESDPKILCERHNIRRDCVLIINRTFKGGIGEYVGISAFYDYSAKNEGQQNQGLYRVEGYSSDDLKLIAILLDSGFYRKLCGHISLGSKMREIKIANFAKIPFPKIRDEVKPKLIAQYSNHAPYPAEILFENFDSVDAKITEQSGILELSAQVKRISSRISRVIDGIVQDSEVVLDFDFLKTNMPFSVQ